MLVLQHGELPGYQLLPWHTRTRLNLHALALFICSTECLRLVLYFTVWQLAAYTLVWQLDWRQAAAIMPQSLAGLWVLPWLADARRRYIDRLLGGRWPAWNGPSATRH